MIEEKPLSHPHHTRLYVVLGVLILLAIAFFMFRQRYDVVVVPNIKPAPPEFVVLTQEEVEQVQKAINEPPATVRLTAEEIKQRNMVLKEVGASY